MRRAAYHPRWPPFAYDALPDDLHDSDAVLRAIGGTERTLSTSTTEQKERLCKRLARRRQWQQMHLTVHILLQYADADATPPGRSCS